MPQSTRCWALVALLFVSATARAEVVSDAADAPRADAAPKAVIRVQTVALPPLSDSNDETQPDESSQLDGATPRGSRVLAQLERGAVGAKSLLLDNQLVALRGVRYDLEQFDETTWRVHVMAGSPTGPVDDQSAIHRPIGELKLAADVLRFEWTETASDTPHLSRGLQGCILLVRQGEESTAIALRECVTWSAMPINMKRSPFRVGLPLPELPATARVAVDLESIACGSPPFEFPAQNDANALEDRAAATRSDAAKTTYEVKVVDKGGRYALEARCYYVDTADARRTFDSRSLGALLSRRRRLLSKSESTLSAAKTALPKLKSHQSAAMARTSSDPRVQTTILREREAANRAVTKAENAIRRYTESIPKIRASVSHMSEVAAVGRQLHGKARVVACVYAMTDDYQVPLLRIGGPPT